LKDNESYALIDGGESAPGYFTSKEATGILGKSSAASSAARSFYDLQGRRLAAELEHGIYIREGRKAVR